MLIDLIIYRLKKPLHLFKTGLLSGLPAAIKAGFPARKLKIIAVTGTDGKTTTSTLIYSILKQAGLKVGLVSTVGARFDEAEIDTGFHVTTPDAASLQRLLKQAADHGYTHIVLEATSHGIYQSRLWGIKPLIAVVTNIAHEHLDYHLTYELYLEAKLELLKRAKTVVLNADDQSFWRLKRHLSGKQILTYSASEPLSGVVMKAITKRFTELFNQMNSRAAAVTASQLGIEPKVIATAIAEFEGVTGRLETIKDKSGITVVIDFAHTPQAVQAILTTLKAQLKNKPGRLIAVFGCAGLRDTQKRPVMGKIGADLADLAIFTAEDPRTENIWTIIRQMKSDLGELNNKVASIADRSAAIRYALLSQAKAGDIVAVLGKGHEQSMCYGTEEIPWSDRAVVTQLLKERQKS